MQDRSGQTQTTWENYRARGNPDRADVGGTTPQIATDAPLLLLQQQDARAEKWLQKTRRGTGSRNSYNRNSSNNCRESYTNARASKDRGAFSTRQTASWGVGTAE